jgi:hypothetical protein
VASQLGIRDRPVRERGPGQRPLRREHPEVVLANRQDQPTSASWCRPPRGPRVPARGLGARPRGRQAQ